eukprot:PhF_6_TR20525/c0_g1_i1/m.29611
MLERVRGVGGFTACFADPANICFTVCSMGTGPGIDLFAAEVFLSTYYPERVGVRYVGKDIHPEWGTFVTSQGYEFLQQDIRNTPWMTTAPTDDPTKRQVTLYLLSYVFDDYVNSSDDVLQYIARECGDTTKDVIVCVNEGHMEMSGTLHPALVPLRV